LIDGDEYMSNLVRFGVSMESDLLESFDQLISGRGYANRSEALRDLVRDTLVQSHMEIEQKDIMVLGSLTLVYDHHAADLAHRMGELQHESHDLVISVMHAHVSHDDCMEMIMLRGPHRKVYLLANTLLSLKGVKHGKLFVTLPANEIGKDAPTTVEHGHHDHPHTHHH